MDFKPYYIYDDTRVLGSISKASRCVCGFFFFVVVLFLFLFCFVFLLCTVCQTLHSK